MSDFFTLWILYFFRKLVLYLAHKVMSLAAGFMMTFAGLVMVVMIANVASFAKQPEVNCIFETHILNSMDSF